MLPNTLVGDEPGFPRQDVRRGIATQGIQRLLRAICKIALVTCSRIALGYMGCPGNIDAIGSHDLFSGCSALALARLFVTKESLGENPIPPIRCSG